MRTTIEPRFALAISDGHAIPSAAFIPLLSVSATDGWCSLPAGPDGIGITSGIPVLKCLTCGVSFLPNPVDVETTVSAVALPHGEVPMNTPALDSVTLRPLLAEAAARPART